VESRKLAGNPVPTPGKSTKYEERSSRRKVDSGSNRQQPEENAGVVVAKPKRKREGDQESAAEGQSAKRRKTEFSHDEEIEGEEGQVKNRTRDRFILFLGNLKYTTSHDAILAHFSACDPPPSIRLLTPKLQKTVHKSKGCAFLEFTHRNALQQALKLHHSVLDSRKINVELSAGGGGKSVIRVAKIQKRNKELHDQRKKRQQQAAVNTPHDDTKADSQNPRQRYSATAGVEQPPQRPRTWSTIQDGDAGVVHRGGQKHSKKRNKKEGLRLPDWGTGVNAIPIRS